MMGLHEIRGPSGIKLSSLNQQSDTLSIEPRGQAHSTKLQQMLNTNCLRISHANAGLLIDTVHLHTFLLGFVCLFYCRMAYASIFLKHQRIANNSLWDI